MKILYTLPALDGGGIDRIIYDYTLRFPEDIQCDFLVHTDYEGILESDLKNKGYNIFHVPPLHKDRKRYISDIKSIMKCGNYDIVHVNQGFKGLFYLYFAKKNNIQVRITHAHTSNIPESKKECVIRKATTFLVKKMTTVFFACGCSAAKWMWGIDLFNSDQIYIMKNAIDSKKFAFSNEKRKKLREEFNITDKFVIGCVARFSAEKNHEFLIKVFSEIKKERSDAVLLLVGRGELEDDVRRQVEQLGLSEAVLFLGVRNDVYNLLNAMDIFLLPSKYEGLPVTLVEAQANGVTTITTDTVTKEVKFQENTYFFSLDKGEVWWAKKILSISGDRNKDSKFLEYDLVWNVDLLLKKYEYCIKEVEYDKKK